MPSYTPADRVALNVVKVPEVTVVFWIVKIFATTLGETAGDAVSMSLGLGYLVGTVAFAVVFAIFVIAQIRVTRYHAALYWATIVATTTVGTTLADFVDRSLGIGYAGGASVLAAMLLTSLYAWRRTTGSVSVASLVTPRGEAFYWLTILFSQTLGTALGDWTADTEGLGYAWSAGLFGGLLAVVAVAYFATRVSRTALFWTAFVLTRPLGAVLGDFLDKPVASGGLALSRYAASAGLLAAMMVCLVVFRPRAARIAH